MKAENNAEKAEFSESSENSARHTHSFRPWDYFVTHFDTDFLVLKVVLIFIYHLQKALFAAKGQNVLPAGVIF